MCPQPYLRSIDCEDCAKLTLQSMGGSGITREEKHMQTHCEQLDTASQMPRADISSKPYANQAAFCNYALLFIIRVRCQAYRARSRGISLLGFTLNDAVQSSGAASMLCQLRIQICYNSQWYVQNNVLFMHTSRSNSCYHNQRPGLKWTMLSMQKSLNTNK